MSHYDCGCCNKMQLVPRRIIFEKQGKTVWSVPQDGWYKVYVTGGGGAGGNATLYEMNGYNLNNINVSSGAGGGGGTAIKDLYLTKGTKVPIIVGEGGRVSEALEDKTYGGNGGTSSFGDYCSASGGLGGQTNNVFFSTMGYNRHGGIGIGGDFNITGNKGFGQQGAMLNKSVEGLASYAPAGGASYWGVTNMSWSGWETKNGDNGTVWGSGGSSARVIREYTTRYGGKGADGVVAVEWLELQS